VVIKAPGSAGLARAEPGAADGINRVNDPGETQPVVFWKSWINQVKGKSKMIQQRSKALWEFDSRRY